MITEVYHIPESHEGPYQPISHKQLLGKTQKPLTQPDGHIAEKEVQI